MPSIRKRGNAYELTAYVGYNSSGKQIRKTKSWKIPEGMAEKKAEKEAYKAAAEFEKLHLTGQIAEKGKIKLCDFAKQWFEIYAENQLRPTTAKGYRDLYYGRIDSALGSMYLDKITPSKIDSFYNDLKNVRNASLMIAEGVDIVTVAGMLGHANATTTAKIYAHQIKSAQAAAADTVGSILNGKQKLA